MTISRMSRHEETEAALHCGEWAVVRGGAGRGVDGESVDTSAKTGRGLRPEIAKLGQSFSDRWTAKGWGPKRRLRTTSAITMARAVFLGHMGAKSQEQIDLMRRNVMFQFFNANVNVEKLCYTSLITFGDCGVPSGDLRRISMGATNKKMVEEGLKSYDRDVKDLPIDLFQEVMDHLACADLALSAPHYNGIMLVGRSRVGRRSLVSLIAHLQRFTVFNLNPATSRKYDNKDWKRDLKQVR